MTHMTEDERRIRNLALEEAARKCDDIAALLRAGERGAINQGLAVLKQLSGARADAVEEAARCIRALAAAKEGESNG
jgi:hypothetical protein